MADFDPLRTRRDPGIAAELDAAGFEDAQEIGRGGFGVVYRCRQRALDRTVAIKVLTSDLDEENLERFVREQRAMGQLSGHPNIVHILQVGVTSTGRPYFVMPYHARGSLEARIRRGGPLEWSEALRLGIKLAGALETAHRLGALHRDVKPANILLTEYGEPQLTDFGIARIAGGFETTPGAITGSPAFAAPEVLEGRSPTAASDVYSLGATLFCALTGHAAYERHSDEQVITHFLRITTQPIPDLRAEGVPDDVCAAIEHAMAQDPADRPATAAAFGHELRRAQRSNARSVDEMALRATADPNAPSARSRQMSPATAAVAVSRLREGSRRYPLTPPSASTKFRPPTPTHPLVARARLIELLRAGQRRRLIVIHAPAGFGKTTLAAQWRDVITGEGVAVAWLTIDHDDNNAVWFLAHLVEAIRLVRPTLAHELGEMLEEHGDNAERYVLTSLINEIHDGGERVAVVIDDWDRVSNSATIDALGFLLDNGCHHLQVIVTSRTQFGLPLSRMRVLDELVEIDSTALRFDITESQAFLVALGGPALEKDDVAVLEESTDGWAAALQLASLSLRGHEDRIELISHMSGRHHAVGEFLAQNVLDTLEPRMLDFLLATSITERICGGLASALAHVTRGQAMLEEVEERDLFLNRIDDDREWFRYHHLFAEYLRRRLERDHPERIEELHRTASEWFADHQLLSEAVDHALAVGDQQRAVELVESHGLDMVERSQMGTLLGLVAKLPPRLMMSSPRLQISVAWADAGLQHSARAQQALDLVDTALDQGSLPEAEITDLRVEAAVVRGVVEMMADRIDGVEELVAPCLSRPDTLPPRIVSAAANLGSFVEIYKFDFDAARRLQQWASSYHQRTIGPFSMVYGYCFTGIAANEQLDVATADRNFRHALRIARESAGNHSYAARLIGALLGDLLYERGNLDEAERLLDESYEIGSEGTIVDFMLATYGTGSRVKALRGDRESAVRRLDEGARVAEALSLPRLAARIENERIRLGLAMTPDLDTSTRPHDHAGGTGRPGPPRDPDDGILTITAELDEDSAIRLLLADPSPDRVDIACARARAMADKIDGHRRPRASLRANLLLAAALSAAHQIDESKEILTPAATRCAELGLIRLLLDAGPQIVPPPVLGNIRWQDP